MEYITPTDLKTHIYPEILDEIIRNDVELAAEAIRTSIETAKSYLHKYDTDKLFSVEVDSPMLRKIVKDIAIWNILLLGNVNIELAIFEALNDAAMAQLKDIQKGMSNPVDWPYRDTTTAPIPAQGDAVAYSSNPKRTNHW